MRAREPASFVGRDFIIRHPKALVRIPSVNPDLVPGAAGETESARYLAQACDDMKADLAALPAAVAALLAAAGIPTVIDGPSGAGGHSAVEYVEITSIVDCAKVLAHPFASFRGTAGEAGREK